MASDLVGSLPVVDLRACAASNSVERERVLDTVASSLEEFGFLVIDGHGLDRELISRVFSLTKALFELPAQTKAACCVPESLGNRGYVGLGGETALGAKVSDLKEFWHVGQERVPANGGAAYLPNVWPSTEALPNVSEDLLALYTCFEAVAERVLSVIEAALRLPRQHLSSMIVSGNSVLRLIHYPPLPPSVPDGAVRAAAHEDINLITLLVEGSSGGLELQRRDGSWMPVASLAGQIVVNVGDMLERVTNGRLRSTTHRVVNPVDARAPRYSIPFFVHPRPSVLLDPIVATNDARRFDPITADAFLTERLTAIRSQETPSP